MEINQFQLFKSCSHDRQKRCWRREFLFLFFFLFHVITVSFEASADRKSQGPEILHQRPPWDSLWVQQMSPRLEGHMLPGLLLEARQLVIEFNTSLFSPQPRVQGPSFKLFLVTFCLVPLFPTSDTLSDSTAPALLWALFDFREENARSYSCWVWLDHQVGVYWSVRPPWWKCEITYTHPLCMMSASLGCLTSLLLKAYWSQTVFSSNNHNVSSVSAACFIKLFQFYAQQWIIHSYKQAAGKHEGNII